MPNEAGFAPVKLSTTAEISSEYEIHPFLERFLSIAKPYAPFSIC